MIVITLPWPRAKLNPNRSKGLYWDATSALRKQARDGAVLLTKNAMKGQAVGAGAIALTITFIQPDRRARDRDNLLAALNPSLDGVANALGVNDARFDPITLRREYGAKPDAVIIEIDDEGVANEI